MLDSLITYINSTLTTKLSEEDRNLLETVFKPKKLRKHQYLLQEGEVCNLAGFIVKGALKQYIVDKTGKENILGLYIENWWVGDRESFMAGTPSPYFIDAFEDVDILLVSREDFINKLSQQPFINEMIKVLTEKQSFNLLKRVQAAQILSAFSKEISRIYTAVSSTYHRFLPWNDQGNTQPYQGWFRKKITTIFLKSVDIHQRFFLPYLIVQEEFVIAPLYHKF